MSSSLSSSNNATAHNSLLPSRTSFIEVVQKISAAEVVEADRTKTWLFDWNHLSKCQAKDLKSYKAINEFLGFPKKALEQLINEVGEVASTAEVSTAWAQIPGQSYTARDVFCRGQFDFLLTRWGSAFNIPAESDCFYDLFKHIIFVYYQRQRAAQSKEDERRRQAMEAQRIQEEQAQRGNNGKKRKMSAAANSHLHLSSSASHFNENPPFDYDNTRPSGSAVHRDVQFLGSNSLRDRERKLPRVHGPSSQEEHNICFCFHYKGQDYLIYLGEVLLPNTPFTSLDNLNLQELYHKIQRQFQLESMRLRFRMQGYLDGRAVENDDTSGFTFLNLARHALRNNVELILFEVEEQPVAAIPDAIHGQETLDQPSNSAMMSTNQMPTPSMNYGNMNDAYDVNTLALFNDIGVQFNLDWMGQSGRVD